MRTDCIVEEAVTDLLTYYPYILNSIRENRFVLGRRGEVLGGSKNNK